MPKDQPEKVTKEPAKKQPRRRKTVDSVREHAQKESAKKNAVKKSSKITSTVKKPVNKVHSFGKKEYNPLVLPDNKVGKVFNKRVRFIPKFIRESLAELKLVTWPTKKEAASKTLAVLIFAIVFAIFVQLLDLLFSKSVKEIILR